MYKSGVSIDVGQFSHDKDGTLINNYQANTRKLSSHCWKHIKKICRASSEELNLPLDTPVIQVDCCNLYIQSSLGQVSD